jgi:hypothetical protein
MLAAAGLFDSRATQVGRPSRSQTHVASRSESGKIRGARSKKFLPLVTDFGRFVKQPFSRTRRVGYLMAMHPMQDATASDSGDPRC